MRSLATAGIPEAPALSQERLGAVFAGGQGALFVRAGAWLVHPKSFCWPLPSATGRPLCAIGATRNPTETDLETALAAANWNRLFAETSGEFSRSTQAVPIPPAFYLDALALRRMAESKVGSLEELWRIAAAEFRMVHYGPLDAYEDRGMRVLQVITSLQRGGAERVALDLMAELPALNTRVRLATLGRAMREAFPAPPGTHELAGVARDPAARGAGVRRICDEFGADLVHGHLLTAADARSISAAETPAILTVHNTRAGWPVGLTDLREHDTAMLAACARAVAADLQDAKMPVPIRTVRNGIALSEFRLSRERIAAGKQWRKKWGFGPDDFVMVAVANPRPQKRLYLLPPILAALREKLGCRRGEARLVFVGEVLRGNVDAERCQSEARAETARLGLEPHSRWTGPISDVAEILAAADVLVSTSAHEGLSLAQVEALAMGCAVVATDVGGAREIAAGAEGFYLVPPDSPPQKFAEVLEQLAVGQNRQVARNLPLDWSRQRMAARYRWLYPRAIAQTRWTAPGKGLWLIANNFSTGGAQASARRLLLGLQAQGVDVRTAVVEEDPAWPTPGHRALLDAGVPVLAAPLDAKGQHEVAIEQILAAVDADRPQSVLFWNLRPSFKVALADSLLGVRVFDISPGEMFYDSMERYFAKPHWKFGCRTAQEYGALLAGVIVKYRAEAQRAAELLGAPVHVVPNGVSVPGENSNFKARGAEKPEGGGRVVFGTAARINPQKRLEDLIAAFHLAHDQLPPYVLRIAGGVERGCGEYADGLKKACNGLPIEWLGEVTNVPEFHRELDAFAMISEPAGCPNASLEAIAAGLPIVATDIGGASEQVINGETGRLVPPRNPAAFAEALVEVATRPDLRRDMALAGQQLIRARFSVERMVADYRRICLAMEGYAKSDSS
jgi:glycosyltransferase involved in cell wall biosynthesis